MCAKFSGVDMLDKTLPYYLYCVLVFNLKARVVHFKIINMLKLIKYYTSVL